MISWHERSGEYYTRIVVEKRLEWSITITPVADGHHMELLDIDGRTIHSDDLLSSTLEEAQREGLAQLKEHIREKLYDETSAELDAGLIASVDDGIHYITSSDGTVIGVTLPIALFRDLVERTREADAAFWKDIAAHGMQKIWEHDADTAADETKP